MLILSAILLTLAVTAACGEAASEAHGDEGVAAAEDAAAAVLPLETFLTNINDRKAKNTPAFRSSSLSFPKTPCPAFKPTRC